MATSVDTLTTAAQPDTSPLFFACLVAGIGLVYLFCRQKFNERSVTENKDYVYQFLPSQLATSQEYNKGFLIYFGTMAFTILLLSLIGPKNLSAIGIGLPPQIAEQAGNVAAPLLIALLLVGVMPNVPVLQEIERRLRQYAHEIAYIPSAALATAERLTTAEFDFSSYAGEALQSEEMRGVETSDFERPRRSLEYAWARLGCLVYEQKSCLISGSADALDTSLLRAYKSDLELIEASKKSMEAEVADYRLEKQRNKRYSNQNLNEAIRNNLYKLYILLGCAVRLRKQPHNDINLALKRLGFQLNDGNASGDNGNLKLVGIAMLGAIALLFQFGAIGLGELNLWHVTGFFPNSVVQAFSDTAWVLIPHVTAIMVADLMRGRAIKNGWWFDRSGGPIVGNYIRVAAVAAVAGYVGLALWGFVFATPTLTGLKIDAPNTLLGAVTGGFYVWHLDNTQLSTRPSRWWERGSQSVLTGLCGLIASATSFAITLGTASDAFDRIIFNAIVAVAVGFALAYYIPKAATRRVDPLDAARAQRLQELEAAAIGRFGSLAAREWLDRPHPVLSNKSPKAACADVEGFEHAMSLLQGPQDLAA